MPFSEKSGEKMRVEEFKEPYRHWVIEDFSPPHLIPKSLDVPYLPWVIYDNDCERAKRTCNDISKMSLEYRALLDYLNCKETVKRLGDLVSSVFNVIPSQGSSLVGDPRLASITVAADSLLYGAGLHVTDPGGWLNCHLDYALHPSLPLERRLSLILFLTPQWREEWGGAFELYDDSARKVVKRVYPHPNRAVIFENGDISYHGTEKTSLDAPPRLTATCYYLAPPRPHCVRKRALFCPSRDGG